MTDKEIRASRQSIIQKLTQARLEKGLTQEQLARLIGTQRSNICRIESGTQNLSLDMMLKIAGALGKDISIMLEERGKTMTNVYSLRLYDEELITFTLEEKGLEGLQANILYADTQNAHLFPLDLELTEEGIVKWLSRRVIPKNRQFVDEILKTLGLSVNNTKGIIDVCMGLSLNDSYWVVPADFDGKFADYNLYENRFSEALSLVAYTGVGGSKEAFTTSPELTTNGMLRKAWRFVDDDGIYLYKGGTEGAANAGNEPYSEYYACQIAEAMGLSCVQYDLENWKGILASKCRLFTDIDTSFVPIGRFLNKSTLKECLDYYAALGEDFYEQLCSMLVFDAVIYNEDRHFGNFGVLREAETLKWLGFAPIYDSGSSLGYDKTPVQIRTEKDVVCKPFKNHHAEQLKLVSDFSWIDFKRLEDVDELIGSVLTAEGTEEYMDEIRIRAITGSVMRRIGKLFQLAMSQTSVRDHSTVDDVEENIAADYAPKKKYN